MIDNVIPFRRNAALWQDSFIPPAMPVLLQLRKCMGLTVAEAASVLHISIDLLELEESIPYPSRFNDVDSVSVRYLFFLSVHGDNRERNIIRDKLSHRLLPLRYIRREIFCFGYARMGSLYGGYTALQWYQFELHEQILPRGILANLERDVEVKMARKYDEA